MDMLSIVDMLLMLGWVVTIALVLNGVVGLAKLKAYAKPKEIHRGRGDIIHFGAFVVALGIILRLAISRTLLAFGVVTPFAGEIFLFMGCIVLSYYLLGFIYRRVVDKYCPPQLLYFSRTQKNPESEEGER